MASVELSAGIMSGLPTRVVFPTTAISAPTSAGDWVNAYPLLPYAFANNNGQNVVGYIKIYQGTVPVDFSTLTLPTSRSSDILLSFPCWSSVPNVFELTVNVANNPAVINSSFRPATASGTATWFRWYTTSQNTVPTELTLIQQIIGTVGATGSGADLEIPSTAIVSGRAYRIQNLRILFPSSWSY